MKIIMDVSAIREFEIARSVDEQQRGKVQYTE
jgi:hypothetical protein